MSNLLFTLVIFLFLQKDFFLDEDIHEQIHFHSLNSMISLLSEKLAEWINKKKLIGSSDFYSMPFTRK